MNTFNGFETEKHLNLARAMLDEARTFERANLSLQGLDAFCLPCPQAKIERYGVIFPQGDEAGLEAGLMGSLGRHLLKIAHSAKPRTGSAEPLPVHLFEPAPAQLNLPHQSPPLPVLPTTTPSDMDDMDDMDEEFDDDHFDEQDDPIAPIALNHPAPAPRIELDKPSLTLDQVKALLIKGSDLKRKVDPLEAALNQTSKSKCVFSKRMSWDAWGGSAKAGARQYGQSKGWNLRSSELSESPLDQRHHEMGLVAIDPGPLPTPPDEPIEAADFERQIDDAFRTQLKDAFSSMQGMAKSAVVICGWSFRASRMIDIAKSMGYETLDLDATTTR